MTEQQIDDLFAGLFDDPPEKSDSEKLAGCMDRLEKIHADLQKEVLIACRFFDRGFMRIIQDAQEIAQHGDLTEDQRVNFCERAHKIDALQHALRALVLDHGRD